MISEHHIYVIWFVFIFAGNLVHFIYILCMASVNERRRYNVTSSLIGWDHTQNDPSTHFDPADKLTLNQELNGRLYQHLWATVYQLVTLINILCVNQSVKW